MNDRMKILNKALNSKEEVYLKEEKGSNENEVSKEFREIKKIFDNSYLRESFMPGRTVSTLGDDYNVPGAGNLPLNKSQVSLQPNEALEISIKRALASGVPINDLDFYEEVNWHLAGLGFSAQSPVMIKEAVTNLINK